MNNTKKSASNSLLRILGMGAIVFVLAFVGIQGLLVKSEVQKFIVAAMQSTKAGLCDKGIRTPLYECNQQVSFIKQGSSHPDSSAAERLAYLPNITAVVNKLSWPDKTSASAAKFVTLVGLLQHSRKHDNSGSYEGIDNLVEILASVWATYPQFVVTQTCIFCGSYRSSIIEKLGQEKAQNLPVISIMAKTHPLLFASVYPHLDKKEALEAAQQLALLKGAGTSTSAKAIGKHLSSDMPELYLNAWITKGLNGTRALNNLDFNKVPLETRILAWQSGILLGYDNIKLTQHLTAKGYRPALRWLVWQQGTPLKYLQRGGGRHHKKQYDYLLQQHTNFGHLKGDELAKFYSDNWAAIAWNDQQNKWSAN